MTAAINPTTQQFSTPYLTADEYRNAPTAIDIDNLVFNSSDPDVQNSELVNVIARASSMADSFCRQILGATLNTETQRTRVKSDGTLRFHPRYSPVIALTNLNYGFYPNQMVSAADVTLSWLEEQQIIYPYANLANAWTSQGPIAFGGTGTTGQEVFLKYTYVNGYVNTLIDTAVAGQDTLTVKSGLGITIGQQLKIYDGMYTEDVFVSEEYVFGSKIVPLTDPLAFSHTTGTSISALPPAVKEAVILYTTSLLKVRGDNSLTMGVGTLPSQGVAGNQNIGDEIAMAEKLLLPYRRIR